MAAAVVTTKQRATNQAAGLVCGGGRQQAAFKKNCQHLRYGLKGHVVWPRAGVAANHQVRDVGVSGGEIGQMICAAVTGG